MFVYFICVSALISGGKVKRSVEFGMASGNGGHSEVLRLGCLKKATSVTKKILCSRTIQNAVKSKILSNERITVDARKQNQLFYFAVFSANLQANFAKTLFYFCNLRLLIEN